MRAAAVPRRPRGPSARAGARDALAPCALCVAGLDPSGGAGIAADLRAFAAAGAWGCAVAAVLTVQSTARLVRAVAVDARLVRAQLDEVLAHHPVGALKTGALGSAENARAVLRVARRRGLPLVVDPVLGATRARRGARLLDDDALAAMRALAAGATLVTPNVAEAEALTGLAVRDLAGARRAAEALVAAGARAALVKGGHLGGARAVDVLATRGGVHLVSSPRLAGAEAHGTGCTLASLVAGRIAVLGASDEAALLLAVRWSKRRLQQALARRRVVGEGQRVLDP